MRRLSSAPSKKPAKLIEPGEYSEHSEEVQSSSESLNDDQRDSIVSIRRSAFELSTHIFDSIPSEEEFSSKLDIEWSPLLHILTSHASVCLRHRQLRIKDKAVISLSSALWNICSIDHSSNAGVLFDLYGGGAKGFLCLSQLTLILVDLALSSIDKNIDISTADLVNACTASLNIAMEVQRFVQSFSSSSSSSAASLLEASRQAMPELSVSPEETEEYERCEPNNRLFHDISGDFQENLLWAMGVGGMTSTAGSRRSSSSVDSSPIENEEMNPEVLRQEPFRSSMSRILWSLSSDVLYSSSSLSRAKAIPHAAMENDEQGRRNPIFSFTRSQSANLKPQGPSSPTSPQLDPQARRYSNQADRYAHLPYLYPCNNLDPKHPLLNCETRYRMFRIARCVYRACIRRRSLSVDGAGNSSVDWNCKVSKTLFLKFFERKRPEILIPLKIIKDRITSRILGPDYWERASVHRSILTSDDGNASSLVTSTSSLLNKIGDFLQFADFLSQEIERLIVTDYPQPASAASTGSLSSSNSTTPSSTRSSKSMTRKLSNDNSPKLTTTNPEKSVVEHDSVTSKVPSPTGKIMMAAQSIPKIFMFDSTHSDPSPRGSESTEVPPSPSGKPPKRGILKSLSKLFNESGSTAESEDVQTGPIPTQNNAAAINALSVVDPVETDSARAPSSTNSDPEGTSSSPPFLVSLLNAATPSPSNKRKWLLGQRKTSGKDFSETASVSANAIMPDPSSDSPSAQTLSAVVTEMPISRLSSENLSSFNESRSTTSSSSTSSRTKFTSQKALMLIGSSGPIMYAGGRHQISFSDETSAANPPPASPVSSSKNDPIISPTNRLTKSFGFQLSPRGKVKQESTVFENLSSATTSPSAIRQAIASPKSRNSLSFSLPPSSTESLEGTMHKSQLNAITKLIKLRKESSKNSTSGSPTNLSPINLSPTSAVSSPSSSPADYNPSKDSHSHSTSNMSSVPDATQFSRDAVRIAGKTGINISVNTIAANQTKIKSPTTSPNKAHRHSAPSSLKSSPKHIGGSNSANVVMVTGKTARVISVSKTGIITSNSYSSASYENSRDSISSSISSESSNQKSITGSSNMSRTSSNHRIQARTVRSGSSNSVNAGVMSNNNPSQGSRLPILAATLGSNTGRSSFSVSQEGDDAYVEDSYSGIRSSISSSVSVGSEYSFNSNVVVNQASIQPGHWPMTPDSSSTGNWAMVPEANAGTGGVVMSSPRSAKSLPPNALSSTYSLQQSNYPASNSRPPTPDSARQLRKSSFGSVDSQSIPRSSRQGKDAEDNDPTSSTRSVGARKKSTSITSDTSTPSEDVFCDAASNSQDAGQIFSALRVKTVGSLTIDGEGLMRMVEDDA